MTPVVDEVVSGELLSRGDVGDVTVFFFDVLVIRDWLFVLDFGFAELG